MDHLLICRSARGLSSVPAGVLRDVVLVLSDDTSAQITARKVAPHARAEPLGAIPSFWDVSADVRKLVTRIDRWQASLAPALPPEILHWGVLAERGMTTQRLQDALLFICAADTLISRHRPALVHLVREPGFEFEDHVLSLALAARGVGVMSHTAAWTTSLRRQIRAYLGPHGAFLKRFALLVAGMLRGRMLTGPDKPLAVFQLGNSDTQHVDNVRHFMKELETRGTLAPVALTNGLAMRSDRVRLRSQLEARGLKVAALEAYASLLDLPAGVFHAARTWRRSLRHRGVWQSLEYRDVPLAPLLAASRRYFLLADIPFRVVFHRSLWRFVERHTVAAFKPWGGSELFEGRLGVRAVRERHPAAVIFHYWLGLAVRGWPYHDASAEYRPDVFLAKGEHDKEICISELGLTPEQVVVVGHMGDGALVTPVEGNPLDAVAARRRLGLPLTFSRYVAVDVSGAVPGYLLFQEQIELLESVIDVATLHPSTLFVLKPHPQYSMDEFMPLITGSGVTNLAPLGPKVAARDFILACDVTISKYSTLLLEAALVGRPTISALMDGDARFKVFDDMPDVALGRAQLTALLDRLLANDAEFNAWATGRLRIQEAHLARFVARSTDMPPAARAADVLVKSTAHVR